MKLLFYTLIILCVSAPGLANTLRTRLLDKQVKAGLILSTQKGNRMERVPGQEAYAQEGKGAQESAIDESARPFEEMVEENSGKYALIDYLSKKYMKDIKASGDLERETE